MRHYRTPGRLLAASLIALVLIPSVMPAAAGEDGRWYLGLESVQSHVGEDDLSAEEITAGAVVVEQVGQGVGFNVGYRFNQKFSLRLHVTGAQHETNDRDVDFTMVGSLFECIYKVRPAYALNPYLIGGLGSYLMTSRRNAVEFETRGSTVLLGAGMFYMFGEHLGLDVSFGAAFINWDEQIARVSDGQGNTIEAATSIEESGAAARFCLGLSWWF